MQQAALLLSPFTHWSFTALLAILSAYVALDCASRVATRTPRQAVGWLLGGALAMGTGSWSLHIVGVLGLMLPFEVGYQPVILLSAWLIAVAVSAAGLLMTFGGETPTMRLAGSAGVLMAGMLVAHTLALLAAGLQPGPQWQWSGLLSACVGALVLSLAALWLLLEWPRRVNRLNWLAQFLASLLLAGGLWWAQSETLLASGMAQQTGSTYATLLPIHAISLLASFGTLILLVMTLVTSFTESRMRATLRQAEGTLEMQSQTDGLTGLPNRHGFEEQLAVEVQKADSGRDRLALLFLDLDGFKPINESFGHRVGDLLLQEAAKRLKAQASPGDRLARWGADEFLMLMVADPSKEQAAARARQVLEALAQPFRVEEREIPIAASVGIALYPEHGAQSTLITHADAAARASKAAGGATYCFFEARMMTDAREQVELLRDLRNALAENQLELYYQPKVHAPSGEITGAEALLRWNHPTRGLVNPAVFIPIAERFGLIGTIGNWVIDEACRQIRDWRDGGLRMRVAINLSVHQLRQPDLPDRIAAALKQHDVNPTLLTCEITESVAMEDTESTKHFFQKLAEIGVHISIDDFGTGYSSLSYLRQLPTEELKIDRGFVMDLESSNDARAVVDAVVKLGLALGLKVVAEGVETDAQYQILRQLGCVELQGFVFAKPMAAKVLYLWAMNDVGPSALEFRPSLFGDTVLPPVEPDRTT